LKGKSQLFLKKTANIWLPILIILALIGATAINLRLASTFQLQDDFAPRWVAAREWMRTGASPYSDSTYKATLDLLRVNGNEPNSLSQGRFMTLPGMCFLSAYQLCSLYDRQGNLDDLGRIEFGA